MSVVARVREVSDSDGEQTEIEAIEGPVLKPGALSKSADPEHIRAVWTQRLKGSRCNCSRECCFNFFRDVGFTGLVDFHVHFHQMHKLDQDRLVPGSLSV